MDRGPDAERQKGKIKKKKKKKKDAFRGCRFANHDELKHSVCEESKEVYAAGIQRL